MTSILASKIYEALEHEVENEFRPRLGASVMGHPCTRHLFYSFRWFTKRKREGRILRLLRRGKLEEEQVVADLRRADLEVTTGSCVNGVHKQWEFESENGHYGGSIDGAIRGIPESPNAWHLLEIKTHSRKNFLQLIKHGVRKAFESHWVQCQMYMHWSRLPRALYIGVCKDDDQIHTERLEHNAHISGQIEDMIQQIIASIFPPDRLSSKPDYYICKMCDYWDVCHTYSEPEKNCRTCINGKTVPEGGWLCSKYMSKKSFREQLSGCNKWTSLLEMPF